MKRQLLTILMMVCAIVFAFSSCQKDKVEKNNDSSTSQEMPTHPEEPTGDGLIENAVTDIDGNTYRAVKLGNQVWMAENLMTTRYADGTGISLGSDSCSSIALRYYPNNDAGNVGSHGYLYNWLAVMHNFSSSSSNPSGVQGICPDGWHVPSDAEWIQLTDYVGSQSQYVCDNNSEFVAKALASTSGWESSEEPYAVGNTPSSNNATGFCALPAGYFYDTCHSFGISAYFWSVTQYDDVNVWRRGLGFIFADVHRNYNVKNVGFSVRCIRD